MQGDIHVQVTQNEVDAGSGEWLVTSNLIAQDPLRMDIDGLSTNPSKRQILKIFGGTSNTKISCHVKTLFSSQKGPSKG